MVKYFIREIWACMACRRLPAAGPVMAVNQAAANAAQVHPYTMIKHRFDE